MAKQKTCWQRTQNRVYPFTILAAGIVIYYGIIFQKFLTKEETETWEYIFLVWEHFLIFMTIWCYLTTYFTDPGRPPVFWVRIK